MSQRILRVQELIKRELGTLLQRELEFPGLLVSIHDVEMTPDLKQCKVFFGVLGGGPHAGERVLEKLEGHRGALQNKLARRVILKHTPTLQFRLDDSVERGVRTLRAIEALGEIPDHPADEPGRDSDGNSALDSDR